MKKRELLLHSCTKEDLKKYITWLDKNVNKFVYACMEDRYTDDARLYLTIDDNKKYDAFFCITDGIHSNRVMVNPHTSIGAWVKTYGKEIDGSMFFNSDIDEVTEYCWNHITEYYQ